MIVSRYSKTIAELAVALLLLLAGCHQDDGVSSVAPEAGSTAPQGVCESPGKGEMHPLHKQLMDHLKSIVTNGFPGVSAVVFAPHDGLWTGAAGFANRDSEIAMTPCHLLFSGSVAKTYTVTAALSLYEQGQLDLEATIARYLPSDVAENLPNAQTATVKQLMDHTAGIPDHDAEVLLDIYVEQNQGELPSAEAQLSYLYDNKPLFAPGEGIQYSSAHTVALGLVINNIAGEHHSRVIARDVIQRLDLQHTWYKSDSDISRPANLVAAYVTDNGDLEDLTTEAFNYAHSSEGDAGILATAYDYYSFISGLVQGEILTDETVSMMQLTTPIFASNGYSAGFGAGLITTEFDGRIVKMGHSGITLGGMAHVYYYPTVGSYIVLLTNVLPEDDESMLMYWGSGWLNSEVERTAIGGIEALILPSNF